MCTSAWKNSGLASTYVWCLVMTHSVTLWPCMYTLAFPAQKVLLGLNNLAAGWDADTWTSILSLNCSAMAAMERWVTWSRYKEGKWLRRCIHLEQVMKVLNLGFGMQVKLCLNTHDSKLYAIKIVDRKRLIDRRIASHEQDLNVLEVRAETFRRRVSHIFILGMALGNSRVCACRLREVLVANSTS